MAKKKNVKVTKESETGCNQTFHDPVKRKDMSRVKFVKEIEKGEYPDYLSLLFIRPP